MKKLSLLLALAMLLAMLAACNNDPSEPGGPSGGGGGPSGGGPIDPPPIGTDRLAKMEEEKRNEFTVMRCGLLGGESDNMVIRTVEEFGRHYNRDVVFIGSGYDTWRGMLFASIAVGDPIDVIYTDTADYPFFAARGYTQPISEFIDVNIGEYNTAIMDNMFSYQGERYVGVARSDGSPYLLFYNKDMLENEGMDDPNDLVARGEWTWRTFEEMCLALTGSMAGDGVDDRWGYTGWYPWCWLGTNNTSVLSFDGTGIFSLNIDDPAVFETMQFLQSMYGVNGRRWFNTVGNDIFASFYSGVNAFINEYSWAWRTISEAKARGEFAFDVGFVRMPYGPSNTAQVNQIHAGGFSIVEGSDVPYTAGAFIDMLVKNSNDPAYATWEMPDELRSLINDLLDNPFSHALADSPVDHGRSLIDAVTLSGSDISQAIERVRNPWQAIIDDANRPVEKPERRPFDTISLTFDNDAQGIIRYEHADQAGLNYGVEWVADGIDGGSLLLRTSMEDNGIWCDVAVIDHTVYDIVGWQKFRVSFDFRIDSIPSPDDTRYEFRLFNLEGQNSAVHRLDPRELGNSGRFEFEIEAMPTNSRTISLMFTAYCADSILIDNFKIEAIN
jgi:ABC-type glycerol-3-phosphate transport system substrate-binding protein